MMLREIVAGALLLVGTTFMFLAAVGLVRQPDIYLRMSATSKATSLGVGAVLLAAAFYFGEFAITTRAVAAIAFIMIAASVSAHMIARAAYFTGTPLWEGTLIDELQGQYDPRTHELESVPFPELDQHLPEIRVSRFTLREGSPLAGRTLEEVDLRRRYDITILAIRRGSELISNPSGDTLMLLGDELIIVGSEEKINAVRVRVRGLRARPKPANEAGS